ncbi:dTMP kinase [Candidatus Bipolaricaulota bacterium]|nr:dTMP kinase [Candidatus Bipolaricaulota bacterium]
MGNSFAGSLIVFEGLDGSGTTTQSGLLANYLKEKGYSVLEIEEPGGTTLGRAVRDLLLGDHGMDIKPLSELFLYEVSRAQLVREKIIPELEKGTVIISDRFAISSVAYQGHGRGIPIDEVKALNAVALDGVEPDATIFLDIDLEERDKRSSGEKPDRIEKEAREFYKRVREGYLEEIRSMDEAILINGSLPKKEISRRVISRLQSELL